MKTAKATRVGGHTRRLLHIGWLALRHYHAYRAFTRLTDDARLHHLDFPRDFAQTLLKLGPLWIKLGQILRTRPDLLPPAYITALARLQEHVPPFLLPKSGKRSVNSCMGISARSFAASRKRHSPPPRWLRSISRPSRMGYRSW